MKKKYSVSNKDKRDWLDFTKNPENLYDKDFSIFKKNKKINLTKKIDLHGTSLVDANIIEERLKNYQPVLPEINSGYQKMYIDHVMQANKGADLDFLVGKRGTEVKRHSH